MPDPTSLTQELLLMLPLLWRVGETHHLPSPQHVETRLCPWLHAQAQHGTHLLRAMSAGRIKISPNKHYLNLLKTSF